MSFSTGELWFALTRLERLFPDAGWREPAERVGRYIMQHRDDAENIFPPTSDHWGAYALDEMQHWATPPSADLTAMTDAYATRLAGIFGVQVRCESQRTNQGVNLLLRGHQALPSGLGTLGEGLGALARYETARGRPGEAVAIRDRMQCAVGMLVARQDTSADPQANGAWFDSNITQMDDQQHTRSRRSSRMADFTAATVLVEGLAVARGDQSTPCVVGPSRSTRPSARRRWSAAGDGAAAGQRSPCSLHHCSICSM